MHSGKASATRRSTPPPIPGTVTCLTQLTNSVLHGTCQAKSSDCTAAFRAECLTEASSKLCASFESTAQKYCFLSCDAADIAAAPDGGTTDPSVYCQTWAGAAFTCRSTGGGSANRTFCGP